MLNPTHNVSADFGLSWKLASGQEHVSNARQGTGFYISPEVLHVGIMSKAADVFSFGMILHEVRARLNFLPALFTCQAWLPPAAKRCIHSC
jgi:serine/threonine protein kinase